jgi:hypothetical protein
MRTHIKLFAVFRTCFYRILCSLSNFVFSGSEAHTWPGPCRLPRANTRETFNAPFDITNFKSNFSAEYMGKTDGRFRLPRYILMCGLCSVPVNDIRFAMFRARYTVYIGHTAALRPLVT